MNRSGFALNVPAALLVLRVFVGSTMMAHGYQKLFTLGLVGVTAGFAQMGVPMPGVAAPLVAIVELFAGAALIIGLLTRCAAFGLAIDMLGAVAFVHFKHGFFLPTGFEFPFVLFGALIALVLAGPGAYSADAAVVARRGMIATVAS